MLTAGELREQSRVLRDAAERENDPAKKRTLAREALALAELAEQVERTGAFVARENIARYQQLLARYDLDEGLRKVVEKLLAEQEKAAAPEPEQARRWRNRAAQFRAAADQTKDLQARLSRLRLAETYDRLAQREEDRAALDAKGKPEAG